MTDQKVSITILAEKPVGYLIKLESTQTTMLIPKKVFIRRIEAGVYDVTNLKFLQKAI
jgi:hypothetical protein